MTQRHLVLVFMLVCVSTFPAYSYAAPPKRKAASAAAKSANDFVGLYEAKITNRKTGKTSRRTFELTEDGKILKAGKDDVGKWTAEKSMLVLEWQAGETLKLRPKSRGDLRATSKSADNVVLNWRVMRVEPVAIWKIETAAGTDAQTFVLYSNGKANDPHSKANWFVRGNQLTINGLEPFVATLDPGGRTLTASWKAGTRFVGRLVDPDEEEKDEE